MKNLYMSLIIVAGFVMANQAFAVPDDAKRDMHPSTMDTTGQGNHGPSQGQSGMNTDEMRSH